MNNISEVLDGVKKVGIGGHINMSRMIDEVTRKEASNEMPEEE